MSCLQATAEALQHVAWQCRVRVGGEAVWGSRDGARHRGRSVLHLLPGAGGVSYKVAVSGGGRPERSGAGVAMGDL